MYVFLANVYIRGGAREEDGVGNGLATSLAKGISHLFVHLTNT